MKRILCSLLVATLPFGSVLAVAEVEERQSQLSKARNVSIPLSQDQT